MSPETAFQIINLGVLPFWLLLLFAPRWKWTQKIVQSVLIVAALGLIHFLTVLKADFPEGSSGMSLRAAMLMFDEPWGMVACWAHYLAFDLFVGAWLVRDAIRRNIPHLAVVPCLVLTNMLGPTGFLAYLLLRTFLRRTITFQEEAPSGRVPAPQQNLGERVPA